MGNNKIYKVVIILLLTLNGASLGFIWWSFGKHQRHHEPRGPFMFIVRELKMTDKQQEEYTILRNEHHQKMVEIQQQTRNLRERLFISLKQANIDSANVAALSDSIAFNQRQSEIITFYHFKMVRAICTEEQKKKFDVIINDAIRMLAPPPPSQRHEQ